jgi:hypothetical protein
VSHTINGEGIHFSRERLEGVMNIKITSNQKQLKSFLGLANDFRKHVRGFSIKTYPLQRLITPSQRNEKIEWSEELVEYFQKIKEAINTCPRIFFVNESSEIYLYTDASDGGIGAYLMQKVGEEERPIGFIQVK